MGGFQPDRLMPTDPPVTNSRDAAMAETSQRLIDRRLYDYEFALKDLEKLLKHDPKVRD